MSSYYDHVQGSLSEAEIARSEDIHLIQSNIQVAFEQMMLDMFGNGCILGGEENDLKLTPIPTHVDQYNNMYDYDDSWISFYDIYLRQRLTIEKSEIASIKVEIKNTTNLEPTVFAEIRDVDFNLLKEASVTLPTTDADSSEIIEFNFNLDHISTGEYYFVIRPVDISATDLTANGDETVYDVITEDNFLIRYDINGNYNSGLDASYNGTDYLESRLLSAEITEDNLVDVSDVNFDLCFEHIFSRGNTYVIQPAPCIVAGQKVYPMDTHVSIDGPSSQGNRIDVVTLTTDGSLVVTKGLPFYGAAKESNYPNNVAGLAIAYITTYSNSQSEWICSECGTQNTGNISICANCGHVISSKIPLVEQNDDNNKTRKRDLLERVRRLEKKMDYQIDYNSPSRIKYTCEVDPILVNNVMVSEDRSGNKRYVYAEDTYGMNVVTIDGEQIAKTDSDRSTTHKWAFADPTRQVQIATKGEINGTMTAWDVHMPDVKPKAKEIDADLNYYHIVLAAKKASDADATSKTTTTKTTTQGGKTTTTTTTTTWYGLANLKVKVEVRKKVKGKMKTIATINNLVTNTHGAISLNLWTHVKKLDPNATYTLVTTFGQYSITNNLYVYQSSDSFKLQVGSFDWNLDGKIDKDEKDSILLAPFDEYKTFVKNAGIFADGSTKQKKQTKKIKYSPTTVTKKTYNVAIDGSVITGKDGIYEDGIFIDTEAGHAILQEETPGGDQKVQSIPASVREKATKKAHDYTIKKNTTERQSTYCLFHYNLPHNCILKSITPHISRFKNIEKWTIILFKNDKIFNLNTTRKTYLKELLNDAAKNTEFPNLYKSGWINVGKADKNGVTKVKTQTTFKIRDGKGINLTAGTYSILIYGRLKSGAKEGSIRITEYATSKSTTYGAISRVKGTSNMSKVYMEGNQLAYQTMLVDFVKQDKQYKTTGNLWGPSISVGTGAIRSVTIKSNNYVPDGCRIRIFVSNNDGKTYVEAVDNKVSFNGSGNVLKWRIQFDGTKFTTPMISYSEALGYALQIDTSIHQRYIDYEDYGRCYSTPVLNANSITRTLVANDNVENKFEEWEFARLWMEDETKDSEIDICFAYENNNYDININSRLVDIKGRLFYSQIFSGLTLDDFSQDSIDYSNYDASVEFDENNYRFKLESEKLEHYTGGVIISTPSQAYNGGSSYIYGNINDINIDYHGFITGYVNDPIIYRDNNGDLTNKYAGMHILSSPYYYSFYDYDSQVNAGGLITDNNNKDWNAANPYFDANTNIIGVSFENGLEINDNFTSITLDLKPVIKTVKPEEDEEEGETTETNTGELASTPQHTDTPDEATIPGGTLEVVFALNKYGQIEDDNATYGKAYTITSDIKVNKVTYRSKSGDASQSEEVEITSEAFSQIRFDLSDDLYGAEIRSIGIRVKKDSTNGIKNGYGIALGNISFNGYNRFPYAPYLYTGQTTEVDGQIVPKRLGWHALKDISYSHVFAYTGINSGNKKIYHFEKDPIKVSEDFNSDNLIGVEYIRGVPLEPVDGINPDQIIFYLPGEEPLSSGRDVYNSAALLGNLFAIDVDINLAPYDFIDVEYRTAQELFSNSFDADLNADAGEIFKGDIILDLYDTRDIIGVEPVQSLALPAWGRIQHAYNSTNKTCHAWFKKHTDATQVKKIVLRRENPTKQQIEQLYLVLENILFFNADVMPALGPQMQIRVYPQIMDLLSNTKIRKFGCVYRVG